MAIFSRVLTVSALLLAFAAPGVANAEAGTVIFVFGKAWTVSADGSRELVVKGSEVDSGATLETGATGRLQLRMADGGLIALRPNTEFVVEDFSYAGPTATQSARVDERSFFTLLKGGFRSITGAVGKADKTAYRVRTPIATIGIRGTDFTAQLCAADCAGLAAGSGVALADGLYIGVTDGGVRIDTNAGSLNLDAGEFGFAADSTTLPGVSDVARRLLAPGVTSRLSGEARDAAVSRVANTNAAADNRPSAFVPAVAADITGAPVSLDFGDPVTVDPTGPLAYAGGSLAGVGATGTAALGRSSGLDAFDAAESRVERNTAGNVNLGQDSNRDGATGLSWGRWADGEIRVTDAAGGSSDTDVSNDNLHWIAGADGTPAPVLPTTGEREFVLVGNTNPTDNAGNVGTLGSAALSADFTAQTVDADVDLSFAETGQVWSASADDVDINSADATFAGEFDTVTVQDANGARAGAGDLNGFFSGDAEGALNGAGLTYSLDDAGGTEVNGAAAFEALEN